METPADVSADEGQANRGRGVTLRLGLDESRLHLGRWWYQGDLMGQMTEDVSRGQRHLTPERVTPPITEGQDTPSI